jgi:hypothetical protein
VHQDNPLGLVAAPTRPAIFVVGMKEALAANFAPRYNSIEFVLLGHRSSLGVEHELIKYWPLRPLASFRRLPHGE